MHHGIWPGTQWAASTNSGVQECRPLKSNSSNIFPCLCLTISLRAWKSVDLPIPSHNPLDLGVLALAMQLQPWPQGFFSRGSAGRWCYSVPLQLPFYCPFSTWYLCSVQSGLEAKCHPVFIGPVP